MVTISNQGPSFATDPGYAHLPANVGDLLPGLRLPQGMMICSSVCPFRGIYPPSASVQRTISRRRTQLSPCLIFGFWVKRQLSQNSAVSHEGFSPVLLFSWVFRNSLATRPTVAGALYGAGAGLAINAGWRIACPISTPWHALGAHGAAIIATVLLGALIGRFLGNRKLHIGGAFLGVTTSPDSRCRNLFNLQVGRPDRPRG
jgi:hypothetical protein